MKKLLKALLIVVFNLLMIVPIVIGFTYGDLSTRAPIEFIIVFPVYGFTIFVLNVPIVVLIDEKLNL